jgi:uncharacterized protein (UPF0332 family)
MQWYSIFLFKWNLILTKSIDEKHGAQVIKMMTNMHKIKNALY